MLCNKPTPIAMSSAYDSTSS